MTNHVTIFEVGPRDGLQNEKAAIDTADKIKLVDLLSQTGLRKIEVTSFVSPKWVPQMADAQHVMAGIKRHTDVEYAVLTPNMRGFEAAVVAKASEVAIFASASEGFSQNNINCSIAESLERFAPVAQAARTAGLPLRGYVSCVAECPYDGATSPAQVAKVAQALLDMGCYEISLGDTIGRAVPEQIDAMLKAVVDVVPAAMLAGHFHDTSGSAIDNIDVSLGHGMRCFDSSVAGLGGCPYAPGAAGNIATETVVKHLAVQGYETGVDLETLDTAATFASTLRTSQ